MAQASIQAPARKRETRTASLRRAVTRSRGLVHGPVTRLFSPGDLGQRIKPFVFLDHFDFRPTGKAMFPMHPHSGIATLTLLLSGAMRYEDTTGAHGELAAGSLEWLQAGGGVWHDASPIGTDRFHGYQLWLALPPEIEGGPSRSQYLPAHEVSHVGPARVVLGRYAGAVSPVRAPAGINLLHVRLADGERWRYRPPAGHTVAWAHTDRGTLLASGTQLHHELAIFDESNEPIDFTAEGDTDFIVGSAIKHPHELVTGYYSVHTGVEAVEKGEAQIAHIGKELRSLGRIR